MPPRFGWGDATCGFRINRAGRLPQRWWLGRSRSSGSCWGILKPGVSVKRGQEADANWWLANGLLGVPEDYPTHFTGTNRVVDEVWSWERFKTSTLYIVLAAVGLLLLIGCGTWRTCCWRGPTTRREGVCGFGRRWERTVGD